MIVRYCSLVGLLGLFGSTVAGTALARGEEVAFRVHAINPESTYSACAAVDVNRDGRLDVVCGGWWYEAPVWKRHFVREVEVIRGRYDDYSNLPLDVNGDGRLDLISANYRSGKLYWIEQPADSRREWKTHLIAAPGPMETARLVDVDGDGQLDVLPNGVRSAAWWELVRERPAAGGVRPRWIRHDLPREVAGHGVGFGDVDGDGRGDIVGPKGWLRAPPDRRRGRWRWHGEFELQRASIPILVLDVDGDGDSDIVWGRGHLFGLYWLEQRSDEAGSRRWVRHAIDTSWSQPHSLLLADIDGDGRDEVIAGKRYLGHEGRDPGEYDPLVVYRYSYDREERYWRRASVSWGGKVGFGLDPKAVDLDGDGDVDLLGAGRSGVYWLENLRVGERPGAPAARRVAPRATYDDHDRLMVYKDARGEEHAVKTPGDWALRRAHILAGLELAMGRLPGPERRTPLDVRVTEVKETTDYVRKKLTYAAEPGDRVPAYLLVPKGLRGKAPAMLCLHSTTSIGKAQPAGLGGSPSRHYGHELARRGYVCLVPDYPSFGDYAFDFGKAAHYASGSMKAIWNNIRGVDLLEALPEVDGDRIGCIGHSLGGHNAIFSAVFDQRIRAIVSSCGFTAFHHYYGGKLQGWTSDRYMPRIRNIYGNDPDRVPFDFHELIAALAPRPFFVNAPLRDGNFDVAGVKKVIAAAAAVYDLRGATGNLKAVHPDAGHDFPAEVREEAYRWLDRHLRTASR